MTDEKTKRRGDGRIFQQAGSRFYWCAFYLHGKETRRSTHTEDPAQAEEFLKRQLDRKAADRIGARRFLPVADRVTVERILGDLEADKELRGKTPIGCSVKLIRAEFGRERAAALTEGRITTWMKKLRSDGYAPATVNRTTQILGQALRRSVRNRLLTEAPYIPRLDESANVRRGFVSRPERDRILFGLPSDALRDLTLFGFLSSWRLGEIRSLRWVDVDLEGRVIRLRAQHSKEREARSLAYERDDELDGLIARRWAASRGPLVFHREGRAIVDFRKAWRTAVKLAGLPDTIFHDLRRSGIRDMVRAGVPQKVAMTISGHKTDAMFRRYSITTEDDQRAALRRRAEFVREEIRAAAEKIAAAPAATERWQ